MQLIANNNPSYSWVSDHQPHPSIDPAKPCPFHSMQAAMATTATTMMLLMLLMLMLLMLMPMLLMLPMMMMMKMMMMMRMMMMMMMMMMVMMMPMLMQKQVEKGGNRDGVCGFEFFTAAGDAVKTSSSRKTDSSTGA
jgi:hypothetical protein